MIRSLCLFYSLLYFSVALCQPISLNQVNPHYFFYKTKPAVLITSGEHYGAVLNLDFNYRKYLAELKRKGLNLTRTFSGIYCEQPGAFNIANNTLAPVSMKYLTPWARSDTPGYKNGGNKFDLTRWDDHYFKRLKDFVQTAANNNIIVEFTLFCPFYEDNMWVLSPMHPSNNINATPHLQRTDVYTIDKNGSLLQIQQTLVRKLVIELNDYDNVIFEICNEPYFGGITMEWQHAIADVIHETEKQLPKKHLISQNIQNGSSLVTDPHPAVSVFNWHYAYPPVTVAMNYQLNKALGDNETGFRGISDSTYRFEGWRFIISGGALFNHLDYSFAPAHESGDYKYDTLQPGGGSDALRKQFGYLKNFIEGFDFIKMKPDTALIPKSNLRWNAISELSKQYAVYFIDDTLSAIDLPIPSGLYNVTWMHPASGKYQKSVIVASKNNKLSLKIPPHKEDIALKIIKKP
ncbi:MAG TPA: cellulase family glycosylhydrolase [Flavitalea sp.]|nr:cellulase family glycosylhydrolase [Flavitalea sp.]